MGSQAEITVLAERLVAIEAGPWLVGVAAESFGHSIGALLDEMRKIRETEESK